MQLKIGAYPFDANTNHISTSLEVLWNQGEQPYAHLKRIDVEGYLTAAGQSALSSAEKALKTAMAASIGQDIVFYHDDGSESSIALKAAGSISGVKILHGPDFPGTMGPEFATERHFRFSAAAEYPLAGTQNFMLDFEEEVSLEGGGPEFIHLAAINGPPQKQLLYQAIPFRAVQSGVATGYRGYPPVPGPLFPAALKRSPNIRRKSPRRRALSQQGWRIWWHYEFEAAGVLAGVPHTWKG